MIDRRCVSCWQVKNRDDLIKITANHTNGEVVINPNSVTFGRSAYLCYNEACIEAAFKKNKTCKTFKNLYTKRIERTVTR